MRLNLILAMLLILMLANPSLADNIAIIQARSIAPYDSVRVAFIESISRPGTVGGVKTTAPISIEEYTLSEDTAEEALFLQLRKTPPDIIFTIGTRALAISSKLHGIPIVYALAPGAATTPGIDHPNTTGVVVNVAPDEWFRATGSVLPNKRRIGIITYKGENEGWLADAEMIARSRHIDLHLENAVSPEKVQEALANIIGKIDVLWIPPSQRTLNMEIFDSVMLLSIDRGVPVVAFTERLLKSGAALTVTPDIEGMGKQAAEMVLRILSDKRHTITLPEAPKKVNVSVNYKLLSKFGIIAPAGTNAEPESKR